MPRQDMHMGRNPWLLRPVHLILPSLLFRHIFSPFTLEEFLPLHLQHLRVPCRKRREGYECRGVRILCPAGVLPEEIPAKLVSTDHDSL